MSKPISVPVITSTGEVWYSGEKAGTVTRLRDSRYWVAHPLDTQEHTRFASKKKATEYLVDRVKLALRGLGPDHYRRFETSKATRSLAPLAGEYETYYEAQFDPNFSKVPRAILACREVWVNDEPRILVHHPQQGPCTYEGLPGFRRLDPKATITTRPHYQEAGSE